MSNIDVTTEYLKRIESQLSEARRDRRQLLEKSHAIEIEVAKNTVSLDDHMRRTDANEIRIKILEKFKWYFAGLVTIATIISEIIGRLI